MYKLNKLFAYHFPNYFSINKFSRLTIILVILSIFLFDINAKTMTNLNDIREIIKKENYQEALNLLNAKEETHGKNYDFYFLKGRVYQELKLNNRAFEAYTKSILLNKENYKAYLNRAMIKGADGDFNGAVKDLENANKIEANKPQYYLNLGIVYASLNRPLDSIESFLNAINIDKDFTDAYNNLGITYYHRNNLELACDNWKIAANKNDQTSKLWVEDYCK